VNEKHFRAAAGRALLAACAVSVLFLVGCGARDRAEGYEIAVLPKGLTHQFWLTVKAGAEAAAAEQGARIIWQGPARETEVARQMDIVDDMINRRVDAIVLAACDEDALVSSVDKAMDAGIPVITMDSGVQSDRPISFVATDNIAGAALAAETLVELIGGEGRVGMIPFVAGAATSELRERGFREGLEAHPGVRLERVIYCDSDVAKAMNAAQDMAAQVDGIFAANEPAAIGAVQGLKMLDLAGEMKLVAFDAAEQEIAGLKEGSIHALIVQDPYQMGYASVKAAIDVLEGREVPDRIDTGVTVVTLDNYDEPDIQRLLYPLDS